MMGAAPACPADTRAEAGKRRFVQRLFSEIAPRYDWFNRLASCGLDQGWRRAAVSRGGVASGHRVLDLCTGTGDLAFLCAERQRGRGLVVGADFNAEMLRQARGKQARRMAQIAWVQADAEALPFPTGGFDRVFIGFSTRNLGDLGRGLRELVRVLAPGGRLVILETGYPEHPALRAAYRVFLFTVARAIGFVLTGRVWPFTYLERSVRQFLTPAQMLARLQGLETQVQYVPLAHGCASLYIAIKTASNGRGT